jgi:Uncharacterized alpha/beta hydrolase domain (DUF2235)
MVTAGAVNDPNAVHAAPRPISSVEQRWFVGAHANVGGGYASDLLAQIPLRWIMKRASLHELTFRNDVDIDGDVVTAPTIDSYKKFANGAYSMIYNPFFRKIGGDPELRDDGAHGIIVFIAALLISVVGTYLHAAARVNDCLAAPNASSPWGQHLSYRIDRQNNRKCRYLHATLGLLHRPAKPSDLHAPSSAAGAPMSGSSAGSAPRLPHIRKLVVKPQPAPGVSTITKETIKRSDAPSISQEFPLQGSTPQMDRSQPADVSAAPGTTPEAATLGVAVADADAVRPDADNTKPAAATAMGGGG